MDLGLLVPVRPWPHTHDTGCAKLYGVCAGCTDPAGVHAVQGVQGAQGVQGVPIMQGVS